MAVPIRRLALSRRSFLRGTGACLALPWLDAHLPALAGAAPARPARALWVFAPNGMKMDDWTPSREGESFPLPHLLEPFAAVRDRMLVLSGLAIDAGFAHGDGPGDHARSASTFLTCAHPNKTAGADIRVGPSIDQLSAAALDGQTPFRSLEIGMEGGRSAGNCDSGYSCAYSNNVSWRSATAPVGKETDPRALFRRLFGDPNAVRDAATQSAERERLRSVLDVAFADVKRLDRRLAPQDRAKLDQYLTAVRDLEQRLERQASDLADRRREAPIEVLEQLDEDGFRGRLRAMYDLLALAFQTESTRVASFMLGNGGSNRGYRSIGVPSGHHELSHHRKDPSKLSAIRRINRFHSEEMARFLTSLDAIDDGGGSLLDGCMVLFGSGISDGNRHNHDDLPVAVFGSGHGRLKTGRHLRYDRATPMAGLHLAMARALDTDLDSFADADGVLPVLTSA